MASLERLQICTAYNLMWTTWSRTVHHNSVEHVIYHQRREPRMFIVPLTIHIFFSLQHFNAPLSTYVLVWSCHIFTKTIQPYLFHNFRFQTLVNWDIIFSNKFLKFLYKRRLFSILGPQIFVKAKRLTMPREVILYS